VEYHNKIKHHKQDTVNELNRLMKRFLLATFIAFSLLSTADLQAQSNATTIEHLSVDIWPDYDRPAVLVLLTGTLPEDSTSPATITIPIPDNATINAVARVGPDGSMFDDIDYDQDTPGQLTLTTSDNRFRVEYYVPYSADGSERSFAFDWQAQVNVDEVVTSIQQPVAATNVAVNPVADNVTTGQDGLRYHNLASIAVLAGESYFIDASYSNPGGQLSADLLEGEPSVNPEVPALPLLGSNESSAHTDSGFNWLLALAVMAGILVVAVAVWLLVSRQKSSKRVRKPRPKRQVTPQTTPNKISAGGGTSVAKFCHECGQSLEAGDRFCRNCGTAVKGVP
jgi:hypothetical protein